MIKKLSVAVLISVAGSSASSAPSSREFLFNGRMYTYDEAMSMSSPPAGVIVVKGIEKCKGGVERVLGVSGNSLALINVVEGGSHGAAVFSTSRTGRKSWDSGLYQVNEVNWKTYEERFTPFDIRWNDCANMIVATYRMQRFFREAVSEYWRGVSNKESGDVLLDRFLYGIAGYHSETEEIRNIYKERLKSHLPKLLSILLTSAVRQVASR